jgi:hypothetical protein
MVVLSKVSLKCVFKHKRSSADNIFSGRAKSTMSRFFLPHGAAVPSGPGLPNYRGFTVDTHLYTPDSVGLLRTSYQPDAENYT